MAYDYNPEDHFNGFVRKEDYLKVTPWENASDHNSVTPDEIVNPHSVVKLMGYVGHDYFYKMPSGLNHLIHYNCHGWAFGINAWVNFGYIEKIGLRVITTEVYKNEIDYLRNALEVTLEKYKPRIKQLNPNLDRQLQSIKILKARINKNNKLEYENSANSFTEYTPKENDIGIFTIYSTETKKYHITHSVLYFDVNRVYGGNTFEEEYKKNLAWTSKNGKNKLQQYPIARMDISYDYMEFDTLKRDDFDISWINDPIPRNNIYGSLTFIITH